MKSGALWVHCWGGGRRPWQILGMIRAAATVNHVAAEYVVYPISDIARCREMWEGRSLYAAYSPDERLWIDPNGKNRNYASRRGLLGGDFRAICNHCGVMAAWSRKTVTWKLCEQFFWKSTLTVKFSKFCFESFYHLTDRRCCVQIFWNVGDGKSVKSCVIYLTKKNKIWYGWNLEQCEPNAGAGPGRFWARSAQY